MISHSEIWPIIQMVRTIPNAGLFDGRFGTECRGLSLRLATFAVAALIVMARILPAMAQAAPNTATGRRRRQRRQRRLVQASRK